MRHYFFAISFLLMVAPALAQPKKKASTTQKAPTQTDMAKMMEDEMKDMSEEDKAEMRKMMKGIMPDMTKKPGAEVIAFTDNKKLVPAKDVVRINSSIKKAFTDADVLTNTALLYSKLMAKMPAAEKAIVTSVTAKAKTGSSLMEAATISFLQSRNYAAIGLAIKAVQAEPKNVVYQNNLAAILSQSGYPEKAIPYLKKLSVQFPTNSTVLHNLGYAWLQLGEVDTARRFFGYAAAHNPANPETSLCRGVIEELRGDPKKAADHYVEAFEQAPNPFTETMAKNVKADGRLEKIDFNKLKSRISIHEYFKKDWLKIPALGDDLNGYESDRGIQNGFGKMFEELDDKIIALGDASGEEVNALMDKGETEFIQAMAKETAKGVSMISLPAVYIQKIILAHAVKWQQDYIMEHQRFMDEIRQRKEVMTKAGKNDKCADYDRKNNAFLQYANPLIRKFHADKIEEARVWVNAYCTWSWYVAGNPKNTVLSQCIMWTSFYTSMHKTAMEDQYAFSKTCVNQNGDGTTSIALPTIPNFTCPAVVSIPFGLDELRLSADAANFDNNDWGIKMADGARSHNLTLAYGIDKTYITEPGKYGNPSSKTGNGSITPPGMGIDDLTPLSKMMDDLTPLSKVPPDELAPLDPSLLDKGKLNGNDLSKLRNAERTRKLLKEMMQAECPGKLPPKKVRKDKFWVGLGKLELEEPFETGIGELELWDEEVKAWVNAKGVYRFESGLEVTMGQLQLEEIITAGPRTVITNGMDVAGTIINFIKGLFD